MKYIFISCILLCFGTATVSGQNTSLAKKTFGAKISAKKAKSVQVALAQLQKKDTVHMKVTGRIKNVCQVKGCWMNVFDPKDEQKNLFVQFENYGFFMPKQSSGHHVVMDGFAYKEVIPVDELRHYAEDDGKSPEEIANITEPKEEFKFMARGVIFLD